MHHSIMCLAHYLVQNSCSIDSTSYLLFYFQKIELWCIFCNWYKEIFGCELPEKEMKK